MTQELNRSLEECTGVDTAVMWTAPNLTLELNRILEECKGIDTEVM